MFCKKKINQSINEISGIVSSVFIRFKNPIKTFERLTNFLVLFDTFVSGSSHIYYNRNTFLFFCSFKFFTFMLLHLHPLLLIGNNSSMVLYYKKTGIGHPTTPVDTPYKRHTPLIYDHPKLFFSVSYF